MDIETWVVSRRQPSRITYDFLGVRLEERSKVTRLSDRLETILVIRIVGEIKNK